MSRTSDNNNSVNAGYGTSEYGERLNFDGNDEQPKCNDKYCGILCYIHVIILIVLAILLTTENEIKVPGSSGDDDTSSENDGVLGKILGLILIQCLSGVIFGFIWINAIKAYAESIIKTMLYLVLLFWFVGIIIGFAIPNGIGLAILCIIGFAITGIYMYCIWPRIPFTSALLKIASSIIKQFKGTICLSFIMVPVTLIFFIIWLLAAVYAFSEGNDVALLLLLSLYWGFEICKNILHATVCGVTGAWYFSKDTSEPTKPALKRTMTTIFGSICFGSMIVAILQVFKAVLRSQARGPCGCIILMILSCIESLVRKFNMYAYVHCAVYNNNFIDAASKTFSLFQSKGLYAIVNDQLTGLVMTCGGLMSFIVSFAIGFGLAFAFFPNYMNVIVAILYGIIGGYLGAVLCMIVLRVIPSSVAALFVCFAEDPGALKDNRPEAFDRLVKSNDKLNTMAVQGHTGVVEGEGPGSQN